MTAASPAPRAEGTSRTTDVPLYWCAYGPADAPPLLILHGGPGAHHDYLLPQFLDLADRWNCIFFDQRGGGRSKTDDRSPVTWRTNVADLERMAAELAPGPLTLVGYSWGGLLALLFAVEAAHGRRGPAPSRLVLVEPAPISRTFRTAFESEFARRQQGPAIDAMRRALAASGLRDSDPSAWRQRTFEIGVAGYFADPTRATGLTPFRVTGRVQDSVWQSLGDFDLAPELGAVRCPALVVHGRQDPIPIASSAAAAAALGAEFAPLDDCGHVPYVERRAELFRIVRAFLDRTAAAPHPVPAR